MTATQQDEDDKDIDAPRNRKAGVIDYLKTVPGILSAAAALITAIAGAYGLGRVTAASPQPAVTVTVTAPARTVTVPAQAATTGGAVTPSPGGSPSPAAATARSAYLADLTPLKDDEDGGASLIDTPQEIGPRTYPDSIRFTCSYPGDSSLSDNPSSVVYKVAGYTTLKAVVGVPSDATNASGNTATITLLQDGTTKLVTQAIALDQPWNATIDLNGTSQLALDCSGSTGPIDVVFADALLSSSGR